LRKKPWKENWPSAEAFFEKETLERKLAFGRGFL
jgi:hypothetical protein